MLVDKTVKVEKEVDDLVSQLVIVVNALRSGQSVTQVALGEVLKLQGLIADVQALGADYKESFAGTVKAVLLNVTDLASALLGKDVVPL